MSLPNRAFSLREECAPTDPPFCICGSDVLAGPRWHSVTARWDCTLCRVVQSSRWVLTAFVSSDTVVVLALSRLLALRGMRSYRSSILHLWERGPRWAAQAQRDGAMGLHAVSRGPIVALGFNSTCAESHRRCLCPIAPSRFARNALPQVLRMRHRDHQSPAIAYTLNSKTSWPTLSPLICTSSACCPA